LPLQAPLHIEGLEPEGRKWLLTNFTGKTKQNFDHTSITCIKILNHKHCNHRHTYMNEYLSKKIVYINTMKMF